MKKLFIAAFAPAIALVLSACTLSASSGEIIVTGAYARATDDMSYDKVTGKYMTGVFMVITNETHQDVTLETGSSDIAPMVEVHEVVDGMMRKKEGGLTIKSHESAELKPGGNHVMLMGMSDGLAIGSEITVTLKFSNGDEVVVTAPVKEVNLEQEHYHSAEPTPSSTGM
jgi:copper(I)-binding protein